MRRLVFEAHPALEVAQARLRPKEGVVHEVRYLALLGQAADDCQQQRPEPCVTGPGLVLRHQNDIGTRTISVTSGVSRVRPAPTATLSVFLSVRR
jgi:hypothetical protein